MIDIQQARSAPALSIRQPWAELILERRKDVELRNWTDNYRGLIWLHTGMKIDDVGAKHFDMHELFTGGLVGIAELAGIRPLTRDLFQAWKNRHLDFSSFPSERDLYGWIITDVRRLARPHSCKGALGLFRVDTSGISDDELARLIENSPRS